MKLLSSNCTEPIGNAIFLRRFIVCEDLKRHGRELHLAIGSSN